MRAVHLFFVTPNAVYAKMNKMGWDAVSHEMPLCTIPSVLVSVWEHVTSNTLHVQPTIQPSSFVDIIVITEL